MMYIDFDEKVFSTREMIKIVCDLHATHRETKLSIKQVVFNDPATIVIWEDNTKTVVKCGADDTYDAEKGLAMCIAKKALGNKGNYYDVFKQHLPQDETGFDFDFGIIDISSSAETMRRNLRAVFGLSTPGND